VNGREAGTIAADSAGTFGPLFLPAALWHREINDLVLVPGPGAVCVESFDLVRVSAPEAPRGFQAR
jgi:hypothetical protein